MIVNEKARLARGINRHTATDHDCPRSHLRQHPCRLLSYRHLLLKLSTEERPASLMSFVEAWYAYRDFFDLVLGSEAGTAAGDAKPAMDKDAVANLNLPAVWVYDIFYDFAYYHEKFMRRRLGAGAGSGGAADDEAAGDDEGRTSGLGGSAPAAAAAATPELSEEDLAKVWQLTDVMRYLHRMVDASDIRSRLADGHTNLNGFREVAGYYSMVVLARTYTKLCDYGTAVQYSHELGVASPDAPFIRVAKCHASLVLYAGFALFMSRRWEDGIRVMSRSLSFLHRSFRVLDDKEGTSVAPHIKGPVKKMLALLAVGLACCPGVEVDDMVRRAVTGRHRDLVEALQAGYTGPTAAAEAAPAAAPAEGEAAPAEEAAKPNVADALLDLAFNDATPGVLTWSVEVPAPFVVGSEPAAPTVNPIEEITALQRSLFKAEVAQRTAGVAALRSYLRLYTSIDVPKLASFAGVSTDDARAALTSMKIKSYSGDLSFSGGSGAAGDALMSGAGSGVDALHYFLVGDIIEVEEYRPQTNPAQWFVINIEKLARISRDIGRDRSAEEQQGGGRRYGGQGGGDRGEHRGGDRRQDGQGGPQGSPSGWGERRKY